ncbi:hypothetical protein Dsin_011320 [Dipteronia sinensis]|uniref:Uncharacterized protein n=1 Tax=Dipteronia sinensis TaxID=43782 RepID=A0AAE0AV29_9ROSI|nr:hypothetical protein Dsin_011320 [Dipteronia sinensis]
MRLAAAATTTAITHDLHLINTASSSSTGHFVYTAAQTGNYGSYGSVTMEKSFRDCSISSGRDHIETLPLFPMHGEDNFSTTYSNNKPDPSSYCSGRYGSDDGHGSSSPSLQQLSLVSTLTPAGHRVLCENFIAYLHASCVDQIY